MGGIRKAFVNGAVVVGTLLGFLSASFAQADPDISRQVTAIPETVTLSRPAPQGGEALLTFAGYLLKFKNNTPGELNRIYFNADAFNTNSSEIVNFDSSNIPNCTGFNTASLRCQTTISLAPGEEREFFVVARAPASGTSIRVVWTAGGSEGKGKGVGCCGTSGTATTTLIDPATNEDFKVRTKSFVKSSGGTLFTGDRSITKTSDQFTTRVRVDPFASVDYAIGSILETVVDPLDAVPDPLDADCANGARFVKCFRSEVSLPNVIYGLVTPGFLTFVLRIDSSVIKPRTLIESVQIKHDGEPVSMCDNTSPAVYPCITERKHYKNKSVQGWTKDLNEDFEWTIKDDGNGVFQFF